MKQMMRVVGVALLATTGISLLANCGGGGSDSGSESSITVNMEANFSGTGLKLMRAGSNPCPATTPDTDGPDYAAGSDCDSDGGVTAFVTPSSFKVAFKRLSLINEDGEPVDYLADQGTLAESLIYDLTQPVTGSALSIPLGNYAAMRAELYYYEITMPLNDSTTEQTIRVYLSDDDFPDEGNGGHHQGDITLIDEAGQELGWVGVGVPWTTDALHTEIATIERPGSIDPETNHQRGHFGDSGLWNQEALLQGSERDVYVMELPLDLTLSGNAAKAITVTFDVSDTWFWEDFDGDGEFDPCKDETFDACAPNAEWAPIFNVPELSTQ